MNQQDALRQQIQVCLSLLERLAADRAALPQGDDRTLLPYRLAVANSFNDFATGWDVLRPEKLPLRQLEHILAALSEQHVV